MDAILKPIGEAIGALLADPTVGLILRVAAAYWVVVWLASALWAFVDLRRRTANLLLPYVSAAVIVLASPVLFPFAILVHRIVRPAATVADRRLAALRDAALAGELDLARCAGCGTVADPDWILCPECRRPLGHRCDHCGRTAGIDWDICAWCGSTLGAAPLAGVVRH
ncbi:MAG TPA: zinc ribbon domain-containing protein [Verrucomicrobiae bacterium]|nr:zinc ribbon domain-containing protein [Verrucomicrobiae bacterium]